MRLKNNFHFSFLSEINRKKEMKNHKNGENRNASSLDNIKNIFKYIDSIEIELLIFVSNHLNLKSI
jgi:hypothetical protein